MTSRGTISSIVVLLSGPLVGTPECVSYVMLCCIYVAGLIEAGFSLPPDCVSAVYCLGLGLYKDYSVNVVCYVYDCSVLVLGGGGVDLPTRGGRGVFS